MLATGGGGAAFGAGQSPAARVAEPWPGTGAAHLRRRVPAQPRPRGAAGAAGRTQATQERVLYGEGAGYGV